MPPPDLSQFKGLSIEDAQNRFNKEGSNEIPTGKKRNIFSIIQDVVREPMFLLLVGAGLIYFILGDVEEGIILLSFVFVIIGITVYQERKTERALEALKNIASPRALVIRGGNLLRIAGREVVRGDLIFVNEGDFVKSGQVLAQMQIDSLDAQCKEAEVQSSLQ